MVALPSSQQEQKSLEEPMADATGLKKRKVVQKVVITVKVEQTTGSQKVEGPPPDSWSWRKYGQKPIKGSPYPRSYYKCSSSKGCPTKKQVERSRTDASMFIITYTSNHSHPGPNLFSVNTTKPPPQEHPSAEEDREFDQQAVDGGEKHPSTLFSEVITQLTPLNDDLAADALLDEWEFLPYTKKETSSQQPSKLSEEFHDFFDELEELPIPGPACTSLVTSSLFDERLLPS